MPVGGIFYLLGTQTFYAKKKRSIFYLVAPGRRSVYTYCVCVVVGGWGGGRATHRI